MLAQFFGAELGIRIKDTRGGFVNRREDEISTTTPRAGVRQHSCTMQGIEILTPTKKRAYRSYFGAELGIRTPGSSHFNGFQDRRFRPLSQLRMYDNC